MSSKKIKTSNIYIDSLIKNHGCFNFLDFWGVCLSKLSDPRSRASIQIYLKSIQIYLKSMQIYLESIQIYLESVQFLLKSLQFLLKSFNFLLKAQRDVIKKVKTSQNYTRYLDQDVAACSNFRRSKKKLKHQIFL